MHIIKKVFISIFYAVCTVCQYFVLTTLSNKVRLFVLLVLTLSSEGCNHYIWKKSNK